MGDFFGLAGRVEVLHRDKEGKLLNYREIENLVTHSGRALAAKLVIGTTSSTATVLVLGSNAMVLNASNTTTVVTGEHGVAASGLSRTAATVSIVGPTSAQWTFTWTSASDGMVVQSEAIAMNTTVGSELLAAQTFASITVNSNDTLQVTHHVSFN
jgi:hypothetical protein